MPTAQSTDKLVSEQFRISTDSNMGLQAQILRTLQFIGGGRRSMGVLTFSGQPTDAQIVTIGDGLNDAVIFEFDDDSSITAGRTQVVIGASAEATLDNLLAAINAEGDPSQSDDSDSFQIDGEKEGTTIINLKNTQVGSAGNVTITENADNFAVTGMVLGTDIGMLDTELQAEVLVTVGDIEIGSVNILSSNDIQIDPAAAYADDTAYVSADWLTPAGAVRTDARASLVGTTADYSPLQVTATGDLRTRDDDLNTDMDTLIAALITATSDSVPDLDDVNLLGTHALLSARKDVDTTIGLTAVDGTHNALHVAISDGEEVTQVLSAVSWVDPNLDTQSLIGTHALLSARATAATTVGLSAVNGTFKALHAGICDGEKLAAVLTDAALATDVDGSDALHVIASAYGRVDDDTVLPMVIDSSGHQQVDVLTSPVDDITYAEDTAHTTADPGIQTLAVRNDTLAALCDTDGDYVPLQVDADGALYVKDEDVLAELGSTSYVEDTAHTTADPGTQILAVRNDALASLCDTDGDYVPLQVTATGALYTRDEDANADLDTLVTLVHIEDTAHTTADPGIQTLAVRTDARASLADTTGDYAPLQLTVTGDLRTRDDDLITRMGATGAAADDDGVQSAQLRYLADTQIERYFEVDEVSGADIGDWVAGTDVANIASSTAHIPHETKTTCIEMDKTGGTQVLAIMSRVLASLDATAFEGTTVIEWAVKHDNYTNVALINLRVGTDASNYHEWTIDPENFELSAWNRIMSPVHAGLQVGTGLDMADIDYIALGVTMDAAANTVADVQFEEVRLLSAPVSTPGSALTIDPGDVGNTVRVTKVGSAAGANWPKDAGNVDNGTPRVTIATDDVNLAALVVDLAAIELLLVKGTGDMAASHSTTLATDDTQFGAVGAAADVDGNIHGQLKWIGDAFHNDDDTYTALDRGVFAMAVRNDNLGTSFHTADLSYGPIATTEQGAVHVEPPQGTGAMAAATAVTIATDDTVLLAMNKSIIGAAAPTVDSYATVAVSTAAATADQELVGTPGADKQIWVYGLVGTADTGDGSVSLQDEDNTALSGVMAVAENGGFAINPSGNFSMPWIKVATNKALEIDTLVCGFKGILTYAIISV